MLCVKIIRSTALQLLMLPWVAFSCAYMANGVGDTRAWGLWVFALFFGALATQAWWEAVKRWRPGVVRPGPRG